MSTTNDIIESRYIYPNCVSFWVDPDEAQTREAVVSALRQWVTDSGRTVAWVEVLRGKSWGGTGVGRVNVYSRR